MERGWASGGQHHVRAKTKGGATMKSVILFLMRICFKGRGSSSMTRTAFCKRHSAYGERAGERRLGEDYGWSPDEKG